jgi:MoaA/NifB/PqqE/SkfB family radical SAM enzyme
MIMPNLLILPSSYGVYIGSTHSIGNGTPNIHDETWQFNLLNLPHRLTFPDSTYLIGISSTCQCLRSRGLTALNHGYNIHHGRLGGNHRTSAKQPADARASGGDEMSDVTVRQYLPRLPLEGNLDLTYRCNNRCRHCWLWTPDSPATARLELSSTEICRIVDEARALGCRRWSISGGEPMLRADFSEIFEYITAKAVGYTLNTNGTLITPKIARQLKRKGTKMIALYGATSKVYDAVTRNPTGFEQVMQGFRYLKEAGAGFIVQLIPMKANWHEWDQMISLAKTLSPHYRIGAAWLFLSANRSARRNSEIRAQRLPAARVAELDKPDLAYEDRMAEIDNAAQLTDSREATSYTPACGGLEPADDRLFAGCIAIRRDFHVDAYGQMSWCAFIKDPALRYDLRRGSFEEAWEKFIPACADTVRGGKEWRENCGTCAKRSDCRWCPVYSYLETGRYSAPIPYLCSVAEETRRLKKEWQEKHRRYFRIAGITVCLESDLDFAMVGFKDELKAFAADGPGDDNVTLRHHFELPDLKGKDLGREIYRKAPWAISRKNGTWFYRGISGTRGDKGLQPVAVFSPDHRHGTIYSRPDMRDWILKEGWPSLSLFPTDQIWLAPLLADREAVLLHSAAATINSRGLVFVGHSQAGKSTTIEMLNRARLETGLDTAILCDDRNVVRRWPDGWRVHGTWNHSTTADVSPGGAPLQAILFLKQAQGNYLVPLTDRRLIWPYLLATVVRAAVIADWWQRELSILERLVSEARCYEMHFDKSGAIVSELDRLTR